MVAKIVTLRLDNGFEAFGNHFSGNAVYNVNENNTYRFSNIDPWAEGVDLIALYRKIAKQMNIIWSSSCEVPTFPERYGKQDFKNKLLKALSDKDEEFFASEMIPVGM